MHGTCSSADQLWPLEPSFANLLLAGRSKAEFGMSKGAYLGSLIEDCSRRVPPKQTGYLEYLHRLLALAGTPDADLADVAARLWLVLLKPHMVAGLGDTAWHFRLDEHVLAVLERLITRGLIGAGSTIDVTQTSEEGEVRLVQKFDIMNDTFQAITADFDVKASSPTAQIKLIQLLLTAGTDPSGAIRGANLGLALNKLAQIMLHSSQAVNQNAARAAITQIINARLEHVHLGDTLDQEIIFAWLCGVINHAGCPSSLASFCLRALYAVLTEHPQLFLGGELSGCILSHLLPTMVGPLNRQDPAIFSLCMDILLFLLENCLPRGVKEPVELILSAYFGPTLRSVADDGAVTSSPPFRDCLIPYENKMRAVSFARDIIFGNSDLLLHCFVNFDMDPNCDDAVARLVELLLQFTEHDWHRREGERVPGTTCTVPGLSLYLAVVAALQTLMNQLIRWHRESGNVSNYAGILAEYEAARRRKDELKMCVAAFGGHPAEGAAMAVKLGFVKDDDLQDLARWLRHTRGIDKKGLGEYLGASEHRELLRAYIKTFNFEGLSFVAAFRQFLESFRIPGESQVIERFLEEFSQSYFAAAAAGPFADADVLFQIAYSTLMLNTDLHSSSVRDKMTEASFLKNTQSAIEEEKRPPAELLMSIYQEIAASEIQLHSRMVDSPPTPGSRSLLPFRQVDPPHGILIPLMSATSACWARALATVVERLAAWPENLFFPTGGEESLFVCQADLYDGILSLFTDFIEICSAKGLDNERYRAIEALLATAIFQPEYAGGQVHGANSGVFNAIDAISWLYDVCDERGNDLESGWKPILQCLAQWDLASLVDSNHNIRELGLTRLDGRGILALFSALLKVRKDTTRQRAFVSHYAERLFQLPASSLERVIRSSYEQPAMTDSGMTFFGQLAQGAEDPLLAEYMFGLLQRVAREQMPMMLSLKNEAMFGFLRALERFALQSDLSMGREAIDTFATLGDLLYAQHHQAGEVPRPVDDEQFFLKWYHILSGLSRVAAEQPSRETARIAIQTLFKLFKSHGACYGEGAWRVVWRSIILPLLEEARDPEADTTMFIKLIRWSVDLICLHHERLFSPGLPDVFEST